MGSEDRVLGQALGELGFLKIGLEGGFMKVELGGGL